MIPVYIKRMMKMTKESYGSLRNAGFTILPSNDDVIEIDNGVLWNWGWYGGELEAPILLNDPQYIRETSVRGCFDKYSDLMPVTSLTPEALDCDLVICKNNGMKGRNKIVCSRQDAPLGYSVYQEFLSTDREEYRALMVGDKRIVSYRKIIDDKYNPQCAKVFKMCGGRRSGEDVMPSKLRKLARTVMRRSDLDVLGLDLMLTANGNAYLIEMNSAPGMGPYTSEKLWEFIQKTYGGENGDE